MAKAWTTIFCGNAPLSVSADDHEYGGYFDEMRGERIQTLELVTRDNQAKVTFHEISPEQIIDMGRRLIDAGQKLASHAKSEALAKLDARVTAEVEP